MSTCLCTKSAGRSVAGTTSVQSSAAAIVLRPWVPIGTQRGSKSAQIRPLCSTHIQVASLLCTFLQHRVVRGRGGASSAGDDFKPSIKRLQNPKSQQLRGSGSCSNASLVGLLSGRVPFSVWSLHGLPMSLWNFYQLHQFPPTNMNVLFSGDSLLHSIATGG